MLDERGALLAAIERGSVEIEDGDCYVDHLRTIADEALAAGASILFD